MMISKHKIIYRVFKGLDIIYFVTPETSMTGKCSYVGAELTFIAPKFLQKFS